MAGRQKRRRQQECLSTDWGSRGRMHSRGPRGGDGGGASWSWSWEGAGQTAPARGWDESREGWRTQEAQAQEEAWWGPDQRAGPPQWRGRSREGEGRGRAGHTAQGSPGWDDYTHAWWDVPNTRDTLSTGPPQWRTIARNNSRAAGPERTTPGSRDDMSYRPDFRTNKSAATVKSEAEKNRAADCRCSQIEISAA